MAQQRDRGGDAPARGQSQPSPQALGQQAPANAVAGQTGPQPLSNSGDGAGTVTQARTTELGPQPGGANAADSSRVAGITLEGLGALDAPVAPETVVEDEGQGDKVVILFDYVSGAPVRNAEGRVTRAAMPFVKGQVTRLSKLLPSWGTPERARAEARRLFEQGAVRLATKEEQEAQFVELSADAETNEVNRERMARVMAERRVEEMAEENRLLRERLAASGGLGQEPAPPGSGK